MAVPYILAEQENMQLFDVGLFYPVQFGFDNVNTLVMVQDYVMVLSVFLQYKCAL